MPEKFSFKGFIEIFKNSFTGFSDDKVTKLSGSLAYYTVFSMGPLLIVIISLCGLFLGREAVEGKIYGQLSGFVGADTAVQLQEIIKNASLAGKSKLAAIVGGIILLIGATTIFAEIQDSINSIWGLKPKPKRGWLKMVQNRVLSFSVIISLGFLLLVSLSISSIIDGFSNRLKAHFPDITIVVFYIINVLITMLVTSLIFGVIFKVLPDARIEWKHVRAGAFVTAILFIAGKFIISYYLGHSRMTSAYGAAGSIIVILLWVYYSAMILYFGAAFTHVYAIHTGSKIYPNNYAVWIQQIEVESEKSIQQHPATPPFLIRNALAYFWAPPA